jgi:hypothetical protein
VTDFDGRKLTDKQVLHKLAEGISDVVRRKCGSLSEGTAGMDIDGNCGAAHQYPGSPTVKLQAAAAMHPAAACSPFASPFAAASPSPRPRVTDDLDQPDSGRDKRSRHDSCSSSTWQQHPAPVAAAAAAAYSCSRFNLQHDQQASTPPASPRSPGPLPVPHHAPEVEADAALMQQAAAATEAAPSASGQHSLLLDDDDDDDDCWARSSANCTAGEVMSPLHLVSQDADLGQVCSSSQ